MRRLLCLSIVIITLLLTPLAHSDELGVIGITAINHRGNVSFVCNGKAAVGTYIHSGPTIRIQSITLWIGGELSLRADILSCLMLVRRDGSTIELMCFGWDHYKSPTGPHQIDKTFSPNHFSVQAGDRLDLIGTCDGFGNDRDKVASTTASVYYTIAP